MREILTGHEQPRGREATTKTVPDYPHLSFSDLEHLRKALAFGEKTGAEALSSLKEQLARIERICVNCDETAELFPDSVQHSFYFNLWRKDGSLSMNGGIILHGCGRSFSVELCPKQGVYWSTHT